jgi:hypothetical protein
LRDSRVHRRYHGNGADPRSFHDEAAQTQVLEAQPSERHQEYVLRTGDRGHSKGHHRARGNNRRNSDWDLLVLVDKDKQQLQDFDQYAYPFIEMGWQIGEEINPMLYTRKEWEQRHFTPFYHNVEADKIVLV